MHSKRYAVVLDFYLYSEEQDQSEADKEILAKVEEIRDLINKNNPDREARETEVMYAPHGKPFSNSSIINK